MKLTNKLKIHHTIVDAIKNSDNHVTHGDISVTQLIDAPQIRMLKMKHKDELVEDASDKLWALLGTTMHTVLEMGLFKDSRVRNLIKGMEAITDMMKTSKNEVFTDEADATF